MRKYLQLLRLQPPWFHSWKLFCFGKLTNPATCSGAYLRTWRIVPSRNSKLTLQTNSSKVYGVSFEKIQKYYSKNWYKKFLRAVLLQDYTFVLTSSFIFGSSEFIVDGHNKAARNLYLDFPKEDMVYVGTPSVISHCSKQTLWPV